MTSFFKRIIQWLTRRFDIPFLLKKEFTPNARYFEEIYVKRLFGKSDSASGPGSTLEATKAIREAIFDVIDQFQIKSIVDVPCGDLFWVSKLDFSIVEYTGLDIVPSLISDLEKCYPSGKFRVHDASQDNLERFDMILCRDLFVHLTNAQVTRSLELFKDSGSQYLLTTTFVNLKKNPELKVPRIGVGWRPLNLSLNPFNLGAPIVTINEESIEGRGKYSDKCLALWKLN